VNATGQPITAAEQRRLFLQGLGGGASPSPLGRTLLWLIPLLLLAGLAFWLLLPSQETGEASYKTAEASRGRLIVTVSATGSLQPLNQVQVGSELSGTIAGVEVDYNDRVKQGDILARLDTTIQEARLGEARAALQSAQAKEMEAAATLNETRLNLKRCEELAPRGICAPSELDKTRATHERAKAGQSMAQAQAAQARAALNAQETNLYKAAIRAPISGIVLSRTVEPGQTVAASFQTPVLFTLAEDLARMELLVAVDEADIGQIRQDQSATFNVDAYPDRPFQARVAQIRHAPKTLEGVVTYETLLRVDNADLSLLPGMTATAEIQVKRIDDALLVPNAALRFTLPATIKQETSLVGALLPGPRFPKGQRSREKADGKGIWVLSGGEARPVAVKTGASDGTLTEIIEGDLQPGAAVILDVVQGKGKGAP